MFVHVYATFNLNELWHEKSYLLTCVPMKTQISLRIHTFWSIYIICMKKHCILGFPKVIRWGVWSDCANVLADLNLCWGYMFEGTFLMLQCKYLLFFPYVSYPNILFLSSAFNMLVNCLQNTFQWIVLSVNCLGTSFTLTVHICITHTGQAENYLMLVPILCNLHKKVYCWHSIK